MSAVNIEAIFPYLLVLQGIMGAADTLVNHEWIAKLARDPAARREIGLHAMREATYGVLFIGLGWFAWHGHAVYAIAALLILEVWITANDEFVENRTRVLPQNERLLHVFLTLNYGLIIAMLAPVLVSWGKEPDAIESRERGWSSWALAVLGVFSLAWSVRDFLAWRALSPGALLVKRLRP
ncbi:MAG TPA: hypothetical protein VFP36_15255 [Usitatibacter sp.]|nr:hypothetical protein [Usitatibacter sp.]